MYKIVRYFISALVFTFALGVNAQEIQTEPVQKVKGTWYASGLYSFNIANNGFTYSRIGLMGGYLGDWGGYGKVEFALVGGRTPNISAGFTKRVATFRSEKLSVPSTLHIYFGLGYGNVEHANEFRQHDHIYHPDGTSECVLDTERVIRYWDRSGGLIVDTGLIYRNRHMNFTLGYSIVPDIGGGIMGSSGNSANHSILFGVGYTF